MPLMLLVASSKRLNVTHEFLDPIISNNILSLLQYSMEQETVAVREVVKKPRVQSDYLNFYLCLLLFGSLKNYV